MGREPVPPIRPAVALLSLLIPLLWVALSDVGGIWGDADLADVALAGLSASGASRRPTPDHPYRIVMPPLGDGPVTPPPAPRAPPAR